MKESRTASNEFMPRASFSVNGDCRANEHSIGLSLKQQLPLSGITPTLIPEQCFIVNRFFRHLVSARKARKDNAAADIIRTFIMETHESTRFPRIIKKYTFSGMSQLKSWVERSFIFT